MQPNTLINQLPHRRMEAWKWTDVRGAVTDTQVGMTAACAPEFELPPSLTLTRKNHTDTGTPMGKLATNFAGEAYVVNVPAGFNSTDTLKISSLEHGHVRIIIRLGVDAKLNMSEVHASKKAGFVNLDLRIELAKGAKLARTINHNDHADTMRISTTQISAWADAEITQHILSFGAGLSRFETRIASLGENLKADIHGAYLLNDKRHCDMTSYIDLGAENAHIRQSVKGVVTDKARGVFQGKFHVRRPAQLTDAEMRHDAIMLSDSCQVRAKPELEIYADDVACAHGNTVGALDESALFYMRQRGIPSKQARALLTLAFVAEAFVAEAFDSMADHTSFMALITNWLEQNS